MKRVLFLDVDGVLNHVRWHLEQTEEWSKARHWDRQIDPACVERLRRLVDSLACAVVLSSTWRGEGGGPEAALIRAGVPEWIDRTPGLGCCRGHEIQAWMDEHGVTAQQIVILDDDQDMGDLLPRLVRTDTGDGGLKDEHVEQALRLLGS